MRGETFTARKKTISVKTLLISNVCSFITRSKKLSADEQKCHFKPGFFCQVNEIIFDGFIDGSFKHLLLVIVNNLLNFQENVLKVDLEKSILGCTISLRQ